MCQLCHNQEATVYLIETIGDKHSSLNICEACAQKKHLGDMMTKPAMAIHQLLASILELGTAQPTEGTAQKCPECGMTFAQFREVGRFGCRQCYDTFRDKLLPLFRQFHQAEEHRGRGQASQLVAPGAATSIQEQKDQLRKLIEAEKFEQAAQLRDQIRHAERKETKGV